MQHPCRLLQRPGLPAESSLVPEELPEESSLIPEELPAESSLIPEELPAESSDSNPRRATRREFSTPEELEATRSVHHLPHLFLERFNPCSPADFAVA